MKITKRIHSCLLLELEGSRLLFDPGRFSFTDGRQDPSDFAALDYVVITHRHPDHLHLPALRPIIERTGATVLTNTEVADEIADAGFRVEVLERGAGDFGPFRIEAIPTRHEPILSETLPQHTSYMINERVLNPGDSLDPALHRLAGVELLILPVMAPFLTEVEAARFAREMRPGSVLPVHDGYSRPWFQEGRHEAYAAWLARDGIGFHAIAEMGGSVELS